MKKYIIILITILILCGCTKCNEYKKNKYTDIEKECTHQTPVSRIYYSVVLKRPMSRIEFVCDSWRDKEVERTKYVCIDKEKVSFKEYVKWLIKRAIK